MQKKHTQDPNQPSGTRRNSLICAGSFFPFSMPANRKVDSADTSVFGKQCHHHLPLYFSFLFYYRKQKKKYHFQVKTMHKLISLCLLKSLNVKPLYSLRVKPNCQCCPNHP